MGVPFIANLDAYTTPLEEAMQLVDEFADRNDAAAAHARAMAVIASESADKAAMAYEVLRSVVDQYENGLVSLSAVQAATAAAQRAQNREILDATAALLAARQAAEGLRDEEVAVTIASLAAAGALGTVGDAAAATAAKTAAAGAGFRIWGTGIRLTGAALHWIVAGTFEFLAVAVPAAYALAAGFAVASQGAQNVQQHVAALRTATEATNAVFGQTTTSALGLGGALQKAQNAANPGVYEIFGSVINDARARLGDFASTGLQVVRIFDEFAARVTVDLQGATGAQLHGMLSRAVTDLLMLGQVLGNLGHAFLNFASAMPGLAQVLLAIADAVSRVILAISSIPAPILTAVFALEEFYRWGGLALRLLIALAGAPAAFAAWLTGANFIRSFGLALMTVTRGGAIALIWAGQMVGRLAGVSGAFGAAGTAISRTGAELGMLAAAADPMVVAAMAAAAAGIGFAIYKLDTMTTATQRWIDKSSQMVASASATQVIPVIYGQMAQTLERLTTAQVMVASTAHAGRLAIGLQAAAMQYNSQNAGALAQHFLSLGTTANTVTLNARNLASALHMSVPAAMMAAAQAGVSLQSSMAKGGEAFKIAVQQIRNYLTGIAAMGTPVGTLGADVQALGIQSQLSASKVGQLNQAWDAWIQSATAGVSTMSQVQASLNVTHYTLRGFGQQAMTSWGQFAQAVQNGNSALDVLRTGMAEGVVSNRLFESTVRGLVGEMVPFTQGNRAAVSMLSQLAHEAGGPTTTSLKTLEQWAGVTGKTARDQFAGGMLAATIAMGNMAKVAQNLSAVVGQQLTSAMASAIVQNSGLNKAVEKYAQDLANTNTPAQTLRTDLGNIQTAMAAANRMTAQASGGLNQVAHAAATAGMAAAGASTQVWDLVNAIANLHSKSFTITTYLQTVGLGSRGGHTGTGPAGGAAGGIVRGGIPGTDSVHALLMPGEGILTTRAVSMIGASTVHALNRMAASGAMHALHAMAAGGIVAAPAQALAPVLAGPAGFTGSGGGDGGPIVIHNHITVELDGKVVSRYTQTDRLRYGHRNTSNGLTLPHR